MFKTILKTKYTLVTADFKTVALKFEKQGIDKDLIDSVIEKFKAAKDKNKIKDNKEKDIDFWGKGKFEDFKSFVLGLEETKTSTETKKDIKAEGAKLIKEDENWKIFRVLSKDACFLLGSGTKWCITEKDSEHWSFYSLKNNFYFLISKTLPKEDPWYKIALTVDKKGKKTYWDAENKELFSGLPPALKVPEFKVGKFRFKFSWKHYQGNKDIDVSDLRLKSLEGAPQKVGHFYCSYNKLTTLEGAPQKVGGNFNCSFNELTTLEGAPKEVGGDFSCINNQLTTLEGAPQKVGGDFSCYKNKLTTLEGAPQEVGGDFWCSNNTKKFTEEEVRAVCKVGGKVFV